MRRILLFVSCIIPIVILSFCMKTQERELLFGWISSISSIVTMTIAALLYSKYGVEKTVVEKQTEVVFQFLSEIKKTNFNFTLKNGVLFLRLDRLDEGFWSLEDYKNKKILFGNRYLEKLKNITNICNSIFFPQTIIDKLKPLMLEVLVSIKEEEYQNYILIEGLESNDVSKVDEFGKDFNYGLLNNKQMTLGEFISHWQSVISESKKWVSKHSNASLALNI